MPIRLAQLFVPAAMLAAMAAITVAAPAVADGSQNDMFRRHFWRGQAYHGAGYPAQAHEVGRTKLPSQDLRASSMDALIE